jgi:hypothetical protein
MKQQSDDGKDAIDMSEKANLQNKLAMGTKTIVGLGSTVWNAFKGGVYEPLASLYRDSEPRASEQLGHTSNLQPSLNKTVAEQRMQILNEWKRKGSIMLANLK